MANLYVSESIGPKRAELWQYGVLYDRVRRIFEDVCLLAFDRSSLPMFVSFLECPDCSSWQLAASKLKEDVRYYGQGEAATDHDETKPEDVEPEDVLCHEDRRALDRSLRVIHEHGFGDVGYWTWRAFVSKSSSRFPFLVQGGPNIFFSE